MPQFHLVRRTDVSLAKRILYYVIGVVISIGIGAFLLMFLDINPFDYYKDMFTIGLIGNPYAYKSVEGLIQLFVPLLITSVALALSFKMRFWNVGGEGQFIIGAVVASAIAYSNTNLPGFVVLIMMCVAAMVSSGIIGLAIAFLKMKFNTNETLATLMINYIALYFVSYIGETKADWNYFLREDSERPVFARFPENATMPAIKLGDFSLLYSMIIAVLIAVVVYIYLKYTKQGYEISVVGDSSNTARYAGMNVSKIVLRTMFLSAALIGLSGAFTASASGALSASITNNVGWTGVIVAWLSKLSVPAIAVTSLLISVLQYGCKVAASSYPSIDSHFADLLQGIILFAILMADFCANFKLARKVSETANKADSKKEEVK